MFMYVFPPPTVIGAVRDEPGGAVSAVTTELSLVGIAAPGKPDPLALTDGGGVVATTDASSVGINGGGAAGDDEAVLELFSLGWEGVASGFWGSTGAAAMFAFSSTVC